MTYTEQNYLPGNNSTWQATPVARHAAFTYVHDFSAETLRRSILPGYPPKLPC